jgi:hypothetical protein
MAITRIPLSEQPTVVFVTKCDEWLQRAEQQRALAKDMIKRTRELCLRAREMTNPARVSSIAQ